MFKGFLLLDQQKNVVLLDWQEINSSNSIDDIISKKVRNGEYLKIGTKKELDQAISKFLKGEYLIKGGD